MRAQPEGRTNSSDLLEKQWTGVFRSVFFMGHSWAIHNLYDGMPLSDRPVMASTTMTGPSMR